MGWLMGSSAAAVPDSSIDASSPQTSFFISAASFFFNCTTPRLQKQAPRLSARGLPLWARYFSIFTNFSAGAPHRGHRKSGGRDSPSYT